MANGTRAPTRWRSRAFDAGRPSSSSATAPRTSPPRPAVASGASTSCSASSARRSTCGSGVHSVLASDLLDLVGSTPLVELQPEGATRIYAKLEGQNPTGSIKDRVAKAMNEPVGFWPSSFADRKSTCLNSSHRCSSYAVFCLKKKSDQLATGRRAGVHGLGNSPVLAIATHGDVRRAVQRGRACLSDREEHVPNRRLGGDLATV